MRKEPWQLIDQFVDGVQKQNACMQVGNYRQGNRYALLASDAARLLLTGGDASIDLFAGLLKHDDLSVRVLAAAFLLKDRTEKAVAALEPLAEEKGLAAFGAKMTLQRYHRGDLEIRWEE